MSVVSWEEAVVLVLVVLVLAVLVVSPEAEEVESAQMYLRCIPGQGSHSLPTSQGFAR